MPQSETKQRTGALLIHVTVSVLPAREMERKMGTGCGGGVSASILLSRGIWAMHL